MPFIKRSMEESTQKYTGGREKRVVFSVNSVVSGGKSRIRERIHDDVGVRKRFMTMLVLGKDL